MPYLNGQVSSVLVQDLQMFLRRLTLNCYDCCGQEQLRQCREASRFSPRVGYPFGKVCNPLGLSTLLTYLTTPQFRVGLRFQRLTPADNFLRPLGSLGSMGFTPTAGTF